MHLILGPYITQAKLSKGSNGAQLVLLANGQTYRQTPTHTEYWRPIKGSAAVYPSELEKRGSYCRKSDVTAQTNQWGSPYYA